MPGRTSRRRFIAGATCPQCGEVDKIFTQTRIFVGVEEGELEGSNSNESGSGSKKVEERERGCVACDFLEVLIDPGKTEGPTEVEGDWSPVKLLDS